MSKASEALFAPLQLKSGQVLGNRIAKAAMEEGMAGRAQLPDERLITLYRQWGAGGTGLLITGNVMVHAEAMTGPGGVVLDADSPLEPFAAWARAGKDDGAAMWMQISHPGRQVQANMPGVVWGPSDVAVELGRHSKRFGQPVAMTGQQIADTITREVRTLRYLGLGKSVGGWSANKLVDGLSGLLAEIAEDPEHLVRQRFDEHVGEYIDRLRHDPEYALKVERILALLLDHPATGDYFRSLWQDLVAWLEADAARATLTYPHDLAQLDALVAAHDPSALVLLDGWTGAGGAPGDGG